MIDWGELKPQPIVGADLTINLTEIDADGNAIDMTGATVEFFVKGNSGTVTDLSSYVSISGGGVANIVVPRSVTKTMTDSPYKGQAWRTDGGSVVLAQGLIRFLESLRPVGE